MQDDHQNQFVGMGNDSFDVMARIFILDNTDTQRIEFGLGKNDNEYMRFYDVNCQ